jgi:large subunit ribosomal protein L24
MRKKFSTAWKSSKQPRKQRKYLANAPLHLRKKLMKVNLSKELRKKYRKRSFLLRKGDSAKIMRGKFKGKSGKVVSVKLKKRFIEVEGIQIKKKDGSKVNVKMRPSNLQIIELNLEDRKRNKSLGKGKTEGGK